MMRNFLKHAIQFMCQPVRLSFLKGPSQAAAKPVQVRVRQISGDSSKTPFPKTPFTDRTYAAGVSGVTRVRGLFNTWVM
jgi:hypothetical protein